MQDIPLIDISACRRGDVVAADKTLVAVEQACRNIGFMYITGHGIAAQTINRLRNAVIAWFALPLAEKLHYRPWFLRNQGLAAPVSTWVMCRGKSGVPIGRTSCPQPTTAPRQ